MSISRPLLLLLIACALVLPAAVLAEPDTINGTCIPGTIAAAPYLPSPADTSAEAWLSSAQEAMQQLEGVENPQEQRISFTQAIAALTALYQLHGCEWALEPLVQLYHRPGCPDMHVGYAADGRLMLRIERLELQNPAFTQYAVYLCTLECHTALDLRADTVGRLQFNLADGTQIEAQQIDTAHPLWPNLQRLANTFQPVHSVPAGTGQSFKQVFALSPALPTPDAPSGRILAVSLQWGDYGIDLPYYDNEVQLERVSAK
jgi:hypothetical protein